MAKRGYKLQEFVAHSANVNCLSIGKKACRLLMTGGDDNNVNLWAIGKPTSLMSLCGHTSPVESVAFDSAEVLVLAGASTGVIKLWDLEEAKMMRTLAGHRSNCTAVEFHPFGEFFASGSMDTNLRIWDIRKKGCIHTYKGHTRGVSTIRFTPDGRWVVSGGFDNVVKVWDLTAGKLLHDFKFHEGHIRSIDFHPLEFLLATGSADRTVKFWDLETFELIGSARPESTGVRSITFHPDGRTLFGGFDDGLKVFSWEPVIRHDAVEMGWSTLGDLCINNGKLLGCSSYQNSVGIWVADLSHIEPYGAGVPEQNDCMEKKCNPQGSHSPEKVGSGMRSASGWRSRSPDYDTKEIKTIYVDSAGGKPVASQKVVSLNSPKVVLPLDSKEVNDLKPEKQSPATGMQAKSNGQAVDKSFIVPSIVPRESPAGKDSPNSGRESITFSRTKPGMLLRPAHTRRPSNSKSDAERLSRAVESGNFGSMKSDLDSAVDLNFQSQCVSPDGARKSYEHKDSDIKCVTEKIEKVLSPPQPLNQENCDESLNCSRGTNSVKFVNGVAVVRGRTRSLVERFERRERINSNDDQATSITPQTRITNDDQATIVSPGTRLGKNEDQATNVTPQVRSNSNTDQATYVTPQVRSNSNTDQATNVTPRVRSNSNTDQATNSPPHMRLKNNEDRATNTTSYLRFKNNEDQATNAASYMRFKNNEDQATNTISYMRLKNSEDQATNTTSYMRLKNSEDQATNITPLVKFKNNEEQATNDAPHVRIRNSEDQVIINKPHVIVEADERPAIQKREPQISRRDSSANDGDVIENLMQTHDVFTSTLRSRLTKLQVIRHFWERNDIKGAIGAMRKLPDHSVQADTVSVLMEKMEILSLDLFLCLLPVLVGLLDSKMERHVNISLEMLLKLVAVFGPMIRSTVSAPPAVGVDLHAEQRRECCKQCFVQLQKVQKIIPILVRRGGLLAKCALELNLVLQES